MVDLAHAIVVAILTRAPGSGGKTRLFAALGCEPDPALLAALLLDTLEAAVVPGVVRAVAFTPPSADAEMAALLPADVVRLPQVEGDLGARMAAVFDGLLGAGAAGVILIGSDLPTLPVSTIAAARDGLLAGDAVVLGPALDGGYYLIGATATPTTLLGIGDWGRADVLDRTLELARREEIDVALLPPCADVDHPDDLWVVMGEYARAGRTAAWVRGFIEGQRAQVRRPGMAPAGDGDDEALRDVLRD